LSTDAIAFDLDAVGSGTIIDNHDASADGSACYAVYAEVVEYASNNNLTFMQAHHNADASEQSNRRYRRFKLPLIF
jgi:hypothetical protein